VSVSRDGLSLRHSLLSRLRSERSNLTKELRLQKATLAELERRAAEAAALPEKSPVAGETAIAAISRYARKRGTLAARAISEGHGDPGHVRDLSDAAVFGSVPAALALAELTLVAKGADPAKQRVQAFGWFSLAKLLAPKDEAIAKRAAAVAEAMTPQEQDAGRALLATMEERRAILLTNPYDG